MKRRMKTIHKVLIAVGAVFCAAALVLIGIGLFNIVQSDYLTGESLKEAEDLIAEMQDVNTPTGTDSPQAAIQTEGAQAENPDALSAPDATEAGTKSGATTATSKAGTGSSNSAPKKTNNILGIMVFQSLSNRKVPVIEGADAQQLAKGAGHHDRTSQPGAVGNCLIFGHRNTVFHGFGGLKTGDTILFQTPAATYTYKIINMMVANPNDPVMFKAYDQAILTLVTCYPFNYVGAAPQRYVVIAQLVQ